MIFMWLRFYLRGFFLHFTSSNLDDTFCRCWLIASADTHALTTKNKAQT